MFTFRRGKSKLLVRLLLLAAVIFAGVYFISKRDKNHIGNVVPVIDEEKKSVAETKAPLPELVSR